MSVRGTGLETQTNATGHYIITGVPTGKVEVVADFVGLDRAVASLEVTAGSVATQDFSLTIRREADGDIVTLEPLSVEAVALGGQAVALTEQKNAVNIKNVISLDEFVDMADGNIGEFLKFIPGMDIEYNPFFPSAALIRGMPASGTLVQFDGIAMAASAGSASRSFDLNTAANANIDRIEVSKVPTPDMPANAVGGSINVISKSGFNIKSRQLKYNLYSTYNAREGEFDPSFSKTPGPDADSSVRPVQFAYDLSYLHPIKNTVAISLALTHAPRYQQAEFLSPTWDLARDPILVANQRLIEYTASVVSDTIKGGVDWKIGDYGLLKASYTDTNRESLIRYDRQRWIANSGGRAGDANQTTGVGAAQTESIANYQYRTLNVGSLVYSYDGPIWKGDASFSLSKGGFKFTDMEDGIFATLLGQSANNNWVVTGHQGIQSGKIPDITATVASNGQPFDFYDADNYPILRVTSNERRYNNEVRSAAFNIARDFDFTIPTTLKVGVYIDENSRDSIGGVHTYNFAPNGSTSSAARLASNFDLTVPEYAANRYFTTVSGKEEHPNFISLAKMYDLYKQNPSWFVLDERAAYINDVNASFKVTELVSAYYLRMDNKFLDNRLRVTSGVRYEQTENDGRGPLNDIAATYQRNPDGSFAENPDGSLIPITTNALARAKLQYSERGAKRSTEYDGFYPSVNAGYALGDKLVFRAAWAKTIGRPELTNIIPNVNVSDPSSADANSGSLGSIRIVDGELEPWTADNYDLSFEAYDLKGVTASVSMFQKDVSNFFTTDFDTPTLDLVQSLGLPPEAVDNYQVVRTVNSGNARIRGVELSYRQSFKFLPKALKGLQVFANATRQYVTGPNAEDFTRVANYLVNGGITYVNPKVVLKLNGRYQDYIKIGRTGANYVYLSPSTRWDFSAEYRLKKQLSVFFSVRNLTHEPQKRSVLSNDGVQPVYTEPRDWRYLAAAYTFGIKGTF